MYRSSLLLTAALVGTSVGFVQQIAVANSAAGVEVIAKAVTVEIRLQQNSSFGSGVLIGRQGDLYTLVTNRHVICGSKDCEKIADSEVYSLGMADGQKYRVQKSAIKLLGNDLDLAIVQFRSDRNYQIAKIDTGGGLKVTDKVYTAGFPFELPGFNFHEGEAIAVVNKRLTGDGSGYTIIYNAITLPGMSGGGVFNENGQLVAIHGQGDRYKQNTELDDDSKLNTKIGYNRGIPVRWLIYGLGELGIGLSSDRTISSIRAARQEVPVTADEHFIAGFNKFIDPGSKVLAGKRQAIQEFTMAIKINPKYASAYFLRAYVQDQLQEFQLALTDYNQAIAIKPQDSLAYNNRGNVKNKQNDLAGALADYNQAIILDPQEAEFHYNRGLLNYKQNNLLEAITNYNQAIILNPKYVLAYNNRGNVKEKQNDLDAALVDYNQAIEINPVFAEGYYNRGNIKGKQNDLVAALAAYDQSIELNPRIAETYNNRGSIKERQNDLAGALADYNQTVILKPKFAEGYNNRGNVKFKQNDSVGAIADYNQAIAVNPKYAEAYYNRGGVRYKQNNLPAALQDYNQAIIINPKFAQVYYNRGFVKYKLNDRNGAIQDFRQAAQLFRAQGQTQNLQLAIEILRDLNATE
jgi:tetratricopeptide (TPR) repeat protein/V8-like Glu-specific endopeptidase